MSNPPVDIPNLATQLAAMDAGSVAATVAQLMQARAALQAQIDAANAANPPQNIMDLQNQLTLVDDWINTLNAAIANPAAGANDLLAAMQAVDQATATSAGLNALVVAVDAAVKAG
ncbi:hypothetical protein [Phenylobacterium sp.]|jgi:hypothetical protein|uniref:hypothetical protein n=1 Tax=Phenylobacterium sp. TaxID=1871053 RepID=UPI002F4109C4